MLFLKLDFHNVELVIFWKCIVLVIGNRCLGQWVSTPGLKGSVCPFLIKTLKETVIDGYFLNVPLYIYFSQS